MNMIDYWKKVVFKNYANFEGRARRSEFWYFTLFNIILSFVLGIIEGFIGLSETRYLGDTGFAYSTSVLSNLFSLALLVPTLAVGARRLHDIGKSGWWQLIMLIPIVGYIILIVFWATDGEQGSNEHGPNPKTKEFDIEDHLVDDGL